MKSLLFLLLLSMPSLVSAKTIKIVVIDTGINNSSNLPLCTTNEHKSFFGDSLEDNISHGTQIVNIINSRAKKTHKKYCFVIVKAFHKIDNVIHYKFSEAVKYVSSLKDIDIVNMSVQGFVRDEQETFYIKKMLDRNVKIVAASGNLHLNLDEKCNSFPACNDDRIIVVGHKNGRESNYGKVVDVYTTGVFVLPNKEVVVGTSVSAAIVTGTIVKLINK